MAITMVPIRATISIGDVNVSTPYVQSFNVRKQRGQPSTFDATVKIPASSSSRMSGGFVKIYAGSSNTKLIFSGICKAAKISPCFDDPNYVIVSLSGMDALYKLEGQLYTRRCRGTESTWVTITGVVRKGLKSGKFAYSNEPTLYIDDGDVLNKSSITVYAGISAKDKMDIPTVGGASVQPNIYLSTEIINNNEEAVV